MEDRIDFYREHRVTGNAEPVCVTVPVEPMFAPFAFSFSDEYPAGVRCCPLHYHDDIELVYLAQGKMRAQIEENIFFAGAGDLLVISPGYRHIFYSVESPRYFSIILTDDFKEFFPTAPSTQRFKPFIQDAKFREDFALILTEYEERQPFSPLQAQARLLDVISRLMREYTTGEAKEKEAKITAIKQAIVYLQANFQHVISLCEVASYVGFSASHLSRVFKDATGYTVGEYLSRLRCNYAEALLMYTDETVENIAAHAGFSSSGHFRQNFKRQKGLAPLEYRKKNHGIK